MQLNGISNAQRTTNVQAFEGLAQPHMQTERTKPLPWGPDAGTVQIEGASALAGAGGANGILDMIGRPGTLPVFPPQTNPSASYYQQIINQLFQMVMALISMLSSRKNPRAKGAAEGAGGGKQADGTTVKSPGGKLENIGGREAVRVDGQNGFLWKPISDGGQKKLVVLLPKDVTQNATNCVIKDANGKVVGDAKQNGAFGDGRGIYRFPKTGGEYPNGCTVEVRLKDGSVKRYPIGDTSLRHD